MILLENKGIIALNAKKTFMAQVKSASYVQSRHEPQLPLTNWKQNREKGITRLRTSP